MTDTSIVVAIKSRGVVHILGRAQYRSMSRHALIITINFEERTPVSYLARVD